MSSFLSPSRPQSAARPLVVATLFALFACGATAAQEPAVEPARTQTAPAPAPAAEPAPQTAPAPGPDVVFPAKPPEAPATAIPDISAHRVSPPLFVRRLADVVPCDFVVDPDADPVLHIGDRSVSRNEFRRRAVMYGAANEIDKVISRLLTTQEIARQRAVGLNPVAELAEAEVQAKFEEHKEFVRAQARGNQPAPPPGEVDPADSAVADWERSIHSSIGMAAYLEIVEADALFEKVFMPVPEGPVEGEAHDMSQGPPPLDEPRPDWLPESTWEALGLDMQGRNLRSFVKQWAINGDQIPLMFKASILAKVRDGLILNSGVAFFFDEEMPDHVFLRVGDEVVTTDELWPLIAGRLTEVDIRLIVRELLTLHGMRRSLQVVDRWLDDESFRQVWADHEAEYAGTLFPLKQIILFRGYTSLDRYREHYRHRQAYNLWRRENLTDDEVLQHFQEGGRLFFERGKAVVDIAWAPLGERAFTDASFRELGSHLRLDLKEAREADPEGWFATLEEKWPAPPGGFSGDARDLDRSGLRMRLAEDELAIFLNGYSLADDVFYHSLPGEVTGPWETHCRHHAWGAEANAGSYVVRTNSFTRRNPLPPFDGKNRDLAYEDYLDLNYFWWSQEALRAILPGVRLPE